MARLGMDSTKADCTTGTGLEGKQVEKGGGAEYEDGFRPGVTGVLRNGACATN